MMILLLLLATVLVIALSIVVVDHDGYGTRPAPRSHWQDVTGPWGPPR
jgi:hypothetical protein